MVQYNSSSNISDCSEIFQSEMVLPCIRKANTEVMD